MSFDFNFTADQLLACIPGLTDSADWFTSLNNILPVFNITSAKRVAMFLAQTSHESANYNELEENLNYRATTLQEVFPMIMQDNQKKLQIEFMVVVWETATKILAMVGNFTAAEFCKLLEEIITIHVVKQCTVTRDC